MVGISKKEKIFWVCLALVLFLLAIIDQVNAEYIPNQIRWASDDLKDWGEIQNYILDNFEYHFYYEQRSIYTIWKTNTADCTGMNKIAQYMLKEKGVQTRMVQGLAECNQEIVLHDWLVTSEGQVYDVLYWCKPL